MHPPATLVVLSRPLCHLCTDLLAALEPLAHARGLQVAVLDIDDHPDLETRFGRDIPVVLWEGQCIHAGPAKGERLAWVLQRFGCTLAPSDDTRQHADF
jgi:thioredoxin-like negative regulator of GroEL